MNEIVVPLVFDVLIALLLGATIFFAARLSLHLKTFRDSRSQLQNLISDLAVHIEKAEVAMQGLRQYSTDTARDLQEQIDEGQSIRDELQLMTDAGDRLATRLEQAIDRRSDATRNAPAISNSNFDLDESHSPGRDEDPVFNIQDREFGSDETDLGNEGWGSDDEWGSSYSDSGEEIQSEAEKDLYEALKSKQKVKGA